MMFVYENLILQSLFKLFLDICLLRRGPQDVPAAGTLFVLLFVAGLIVDFLLVLNSATLPQALLLVLVINGVTMAVVSLLLWLMGYATRLLQTLIAMLGSGLVLNILQLPISLVGSIVPGLSATIGFILLFILCWGLMVTAHIFRHALSIHVFPAAVLAIGYLMLNITVFKLFLPQAG